MILLSLLYLGWIGSLPLLIVSKINKKREITNLRQVFLLFTPLLVIYSIVFFTYIFSTAFVEAHLGSWRFATVDCYENLECRRLYTDSYKFWKQRRIAGKELWLQTLVPSTQEVCYTTEKICEFVDYTFNENNTLFQTPSSSEILFMYVVKNSRHPNPVYQIINNFIPGVLITYIALWFGRRYMRPREEDGVAGAVEDKEDSGNDHG